MKQTTLLTCFAAAVTLPALAQTDFSPHPRLTLAPADKPENATRPELSEGSGDSQDLSSKATDPTASLMAFNFKGLWSNFHGPDVPGERDKTWQFQFQPVIPFKALGHPNILRLTVPYQLGGRGDEGFTQISLFDLVIFNENWGR